MSVVNGPIPADFMEDTSKRLSSMVFEEQEGKLEILDQVLLPLEKVYLPVRGCEDAFHVIVNMQVRGAPLIAVVGALGLLLEMRQQTFDSEQQLEEWIGDKTAYLISSRPTAINLRNALDAVRERGNRGTVRERLDSITHCILSLWRDEKEENRRLVWNGYQELLSLCGSKEKLTLMTICNTGGLATCSWGTALGVIMAMHQAGRVECVYALETRPYNQGIRLTASELAHAGVPYKLITDSMAAWTMKSKGVDAILVGADQVALNGDTANKIGTYMLAVLAQYHKVAFYPCVPLTSINAKRETGGDIPIEERPANEMLMTKGVWVGAESTAVWNPAFDVTPAALITKIITDAGNFTPAGLKQGVSAFM